MSFVPPWLQRPPDAALALDGALSVDAPPRANARSEKTSPAVVAPMKPDVIKHAEPARDDDLRKAFVRDIVRAGVETHDDAKRVFHVPMPPGEAKTAATALPAVMTSAHKYGITDPNQVAYLLATSEIEGHDGYGLYGTGMHEGGNGKSSDGIDHYFDSYEPGTTVGRDLGNTETGDGERFKGRGFVQVTGRTNYAKISDDLGLPHVTAGGKKEPYLIAHPEALEKDEHLAADAMIYGLKHAVFIPNAGTLAENLPAGEPASKAPFRQARGMVNTPEEPFTTEIEREARAYAPIVAKYETSLFGKKASP